MVLQLKLLTHPQGGIVVGYVQHGSPFLATWGLPQVCMQKRECLETYLIGILGLEEGRDVGAWANVMPVREEGPEIAGG